jgi:hypothetical protein
MQRIVVISKKMDPQYWTKVELRFTSIRSWTSTVAPFFPTQRSHA